MKAGSHWMVYLPYPQAYGEKPGIADPKHGWKVGPYSALIFDIELETVQKKPGLAPTRLPPGINSLPPGINPLPPRATTPAAAAPVPAAAAPVPAAAAPVPAAAAPPLPVGMVSVPVTSSGIVRVPSAEEIQKGDKPRIMTDAEIEAAKNGMTNATAPK
jgi:hypothetical protein